MDNLTRKGMIEWHSSYKLSWSTAKSSPHQSCFALVVRGRFCRWSLEFVWRMYHSLLDYNFGCTYCIINLFNIKALLKFLFTCVLDYIGLIYHKTCQWSVCYILVLTLPLIIVVINKKSIVTLCWQYNNVFDKNSFYET